MKRSIAVLSVLALGLSAVAAGTASADTGAQFQTIGVKSPDDPNVTGFRFSLLYGESTTMSGFDLGAAAYVRTGDFSGFGPLFAIGHVSGDSSGCLCSFANLVEGKQSGAAIGFINVIGDGPDSVNIGFVNVSQQATKVDISGLAVSKRSEAQIGFLNITGEIEHFQFGILNIASNGFLPVFPLFNVPKK